MTDRWCFQWLQYVGDAKWSVHDGMFCHFQRWKNIFIFHWNVCVTWYDVFTYCLWTIIMCANRSRTLKPMCLYSNQTFLVSHLSSSVSSLHLKLLRNFQTNQASFVLHDRIMFTHWLWTSIKYTNRSRTLNSIHLYPNQTLSLSHLYRQIPNFQANSDETNVLIKIQTYNKDTSKWKLS